MLYFEKVIFKLKIKLMKLIKFIIILCVTLSITSCNDDDNTILYSLSNENIVGTYNIGTLNVDTKVTSVTDVSGVSIPFTVATSTSTGDTFQFIFILNTDGTYSASGQYRTTATVTPVTGNEVTSSAIISKTNSGTFTLNIEEAKITFTSSEGNFLMGTYNILVFNETTLSLNQEKEESAGAITNEIETNISFIR